MSLFRVYIGGKSNSVKLTDVPINDGVKEFHFIVAFAKDYNKTHIRTNGQFEPHWNVAHFSTSNINQIVTKNPNVKVFFSIGERDRSFPFNPENHDSWIDSAFNSLKKIINDYGFSGIDVNYQFIRGTPDEFARCVGTVLQKLKDAKVIRFASIAPSAAVQEHYLALYQGYKQHIDFVNYQFYADPSKILDSPAKFMELVESQINSNYPDGNLLAGFSGDVNDDFEKKHPPHVVINACRQLLAEQKLKGIFSWCADYSGTAGYRYEKEAQQLLADY